MIGGFRGHLISAMEKLETPEARQHLISLDRLSTHYAHVPVETRAGFIMTGHTNHPAFSAGALSPGEHFYHLKPKQSASKALIDLFVKYEMLIDCGMAVAIAYYYALLQAMIEKEGAKKGRARFDAIFGDQKEETPRDRRMLISKNGALCIKEKDDETDTFCTDPYQPLDLFVEIYGAKSKEDIFKFVKRGSFLHFEGHPNFIKEHPLGCEGGYNCIVVSVPPASQEVLVRTFGNKEPISEEGLFNQHMRVFAGEPTPESAYFFTNNPKFNENSCRQAKREEIKGFLPIITECDDIVIESILTGPLPMVIALIDESIQSRKVRYADLRADFKEPTMERVLEVTMQALMLEKKKPVEPVALEKAPAVAPAFKQEKDSKAKKTGNMGWFKVGALEGKSLTPATPPKKSIKKAAEVPPSNKEKRDEWFRDAFKGKKGLF